MGNQEIVEVATSCCGSACCKSNSKTELREPFGEFDIRPAQDSERDEISILLFASKLAALDSSSQFGPQYAVAHDSSSKLAGVAGLEVYGEDALLRSVAVAPRFRSQGLGRQLIQNRLQWASKHGISTVYLLTTDATEYWRRHGFTEIHRGDAPLSIRSSSQWSGGCSSSAVAMKKQLAYSE